MSRCACGAVELAHASVKMEPGSRHEAKMCKRTDGKKIRVIRPIRDIRLVADGIEGALSGDLTAMKWVRTLRRACAALAAPEPK